MRISRGTRQKNFKLLQENYQAQHQKGFCDKSDVKQPFASKIAMDLTETERKRSSAELISIQGTIFTLRRAVPRKLRTLWSDILTDIALSMADGKMESVVRRALRRYLMLKAVLVKPLGGGGCRNRNVNLAEKLMTAFL